MSVWADAEYCYRLAAVVSSWGVFWIAVRQIAMWRCYTPDGVYPWRLRDERPNRGVERLASRFLEHPGLTAILSLLAAAAAWTCAVSVIQPPGPLALTLLLATSLVKKWRMPLMNEEAEVMNTMVLVPLVFHAWRPEDALVASAGLWFISLQVCLAYFGAGLSKFQSRDWRSGVALARIFGGSLLRNPTAGRILDSRPAVDRLLCWGTIVFELLFPLALVAPPAVLPLLLAVGLLFHLGIMAALGLGSFLWAFLATYPAVLYVNRSVSLALWGP